MSRSLLGALPLAFLCLAADARAGSAPPDPTRLFGFLTEQAVRVCEDGEERFDRPHVEAGFTWLLPAAGVDLGPLVGTPALLTGAPAEPPATPTTDPRECPQVQARADFVFGKDGVRLRRAPLVAAPPAAFRVTAAVPLAGFDVRREGDELVVQLTNPLATPLTDVAVRVHYEGCQGKSGSPERTVAVGALAAGASATARFPVHVAVDQEKEAKWAPVGRLDHVPASVQIDAVSPEARFDFDVPIAHFPKAVVACPEHDGVE